MPCGISAGTPNDCAERAAIEFGGSDLRACLDAGMATGAALNAAYSPEDRAMLPVRIRAEYATGADRTSVSRTLWAL